MILLLEGTGLHLKCVEIAGQAMDVHNDPASGKIRAGYLGKKQVGPNLSRADLADFLLKQVWDTTWLRQATAISN
jgi:hypothetical protein